MDKAPLMMDLDSSSNLDLDEVPTNSVSATLNAQPHNDDGDQNLNSSINKDLPKPPKSMLRKVLSELLSLLQWSMLAACTIGPGTVVMCSKAGAESGTKLIWVLVAASYVAFMLQKEAGRLTLESGKSFGEAIRIHFGTPGSNKVPKMGYAMVVAIFIGNTALEANCFAGAEAALFVLYEDADWFRVLTSFITGILTLVALIWGNVDKIGQMLGLVVVAMTIIFAVTAAKVPPLYNAVNITNLKNETSHRQFSDDFFHGFIPNLPDGQAGNALSLMATTAIPFNTFLAAAMTEMADSPAQMKRGVFFATFLAMIISVLVVVIGSAIQLEEGVSFGVQDLGDIVGETLGSTVQTLFCVGLYAAAYSSAVTVPLGAAITAKQIFFDGRVETKTTQSLELRSVVDARAPNDVSTPTDTSIAGRHQSSSSFKSISLSDTGVSRKDSLGSVYEDEAEADEGMWQASTLESKPLRSSRWDSKGIYFRGTMILAVGFSIITASAGLDPVKVVFTAQIIGGLLLPWVSICLFLCLNNPAILARGTSVGDNVGVLTCVFITIFLAAEMLVANLAQLIGGDHGLDQDSAWEVNISMSIAFGGAVILTTALAVTTLPCVMARRCVGMRQRQKKTLVQTNWDFDDAVPAPSPTYDDNNDDDDDDGVTDRNNSNNNNSSDGVGNNINSSTA